MFDKLDMKNTQKIKIQEEESLSDESSEIEVDPIDNENVIQLVKNEIKGKTWNRQNKKIKRNTIDKVMFFYIFLNIGSILGLGYSIIVLI